MQKIVYLSNSRDYNEQGNINENKYFAHINGLLEQGWKVCFMINSALNVDKEFNPTLRETLAALVVLEKSDEQE